MEKKFYGRNVLEEETSGEAMVSKQNFNILSSFYDCVLKNSTEAVCKDYDNPYLKNKDLKGKILCVPKCVGSTSAGAIMERIAYRGIAPRALIFEYKMDSLSAAGIALAKYWTNHAIIAVDNVGDEFLDYVEEGDSIFISKEGEIVVRKVK